MKKIICKFDIVKLKTFALVSSGENDVSKEKVINFLPLKLLNNVQKVSGMALAYLCVHMSEREKEREREREVNSCQPPSW